MTFSVTRVDVLYTSLPWSTRCPTALMSFTESITLPSPVVRASTTARKASLCDGNGVSSDCRDVKTAAKEGNARAQLTLDMLVYQIKKFIGAYAAAMNGVDAILFTGGIGENDMDIRARVCADMEYLGVKISAERNNAGSTGRDEKISADDSKVEVWVVPTNEELLIARDTYEIVSAL